MTDLTLSSARNLPRAVSPRHAASRTRRLAVGGALLALACVLGVVESALALPAPGFRLGLANIAVLVALVILGSTSALAIAVLRVAIVGLATGSLFGPTSALAFAGALAAWAAMSLALRSRIDFSVVGISVAGASAHVLAQFAAAAMLTGAAGVLLLAPLSLLASLLFGIATGICTRYVISRVEVSRLSGR